MLHNIERNQRTRATEACLTVDCDGSFLCLGSCQKLIYDCLRRRRTIEEIEVEMLDSMLREFLLVVLRFIQTHNKGHSHFLKDGYVILGRERTVLVSCVERAREADELSRDGPVQVAVLYLLIVLVLDDIELGVAIPA